MDEPHTEPPRAHPSAVGEPGVPAAAAASVAPAAGTTRERSAEEDRRVRRILRIGWPVLWTLASTWRIRLVNTGPVEDIRSTGQAVILACWHGQLLPLMWQHRQEGIHALISEHRDGEIVSRVAHRLGFETVRGSTSRGGGRALMALVRVLREGHDVAITPDGPRGPAGVYAPGALIAAQRAGVPIVSVAMAVDRAWRLRSWDRFLIPRPFARITIAYGTPEWVTSTDARGAAAEVDRFAALHETTGRLAMEAHGMGKGTSAAASRRTPR